MRRLFVVMLATLLALSLVGCKEEAKKQAMPAPYVSVVDVERKDAPWPAEYQAMTGGSKAASIKARVEGIIEKRHYIEGSFVQKGQLMFTLEKDHYEAIYQQALATLDSAEREWRRIQPLYASNAVSQKDRDFARSSYDNAKAAVRQAKVDLDYCKVHAPVSGYSSKETLTEGNLVHVETELTTVNQVDPLYVHFSVASFDRIVRQRLAREGRLLMPDNMRYKATLRLIDGTDHHIEGVVDFVDSQVDASTGSIRARASFPNADCSIMPGEYVRIHLDGDVLHDSILLPQQAVRILQGGGALVGVVDKNNVVAFRKIEIGAVVGTSYLINSGIEDGERIISDGLLKVREGDTVRYDDPSKPAASGATQQ